MIIKHLLVKTEDPSRNVCPTCADNTSRRCPILFSRNGNGPHRELAMYPRRASSHLVLPQQRRVISLPFISFPFRNSQFSSRYNIRQTDGFVDLLFLLLSISLLLSSLSLSLSLSLFKFLYELLASVISVIYFTPPTMFFLLSQINIYLPLYSSQSHLLLSGPDNLSDFLSTPLSPSSSPSLPDSFLSPSVTRTHTAPPLHLPFFSQLCSLI